MVNCENKMLLTGVSGLLGANFALEASKEWNVSGVYNDHFVSLPNVNSLHVNLLNPDELLPQLDRLCPTTIVHLAAATNVDWCEENPEQAKRLNVETTKCLAQWAATHRCKFVFMSTDAVFDGTKGGYVESDSIRPLNCYAASKCDAETAVREAVSNHLIIRANIFGWNLQPKLSLAEWILSRAETGQTIPGFTDVIFAPVLVNTLSEIILKMLAMGATGTFHVAGATAHSKYEFAKAIVQTFGLDASLVQQATAQFAALRARRSLNTWLRTDKLQAECGIAPPIVQMDILRFKEFSDSGKVARLKSFCMATL